MNRDPNDLPFLYKFLLHVPWSLAVGYPIGAALNSRMLPKRIRQRGGGKAVAALLGLATSTEICLEHYRQKNDPWNSAIGIGFATIVVESLPAFSYFPRRYRFPTAVAAGVVTGGFGYWAGSFFQEKVKCQKQARTT